MNYMTERINSLQGLRVIAMLIIFLYHAELFPFGHFAVTFFFILSGFVAYYADKNKNEINIKSSISYFFNKIKKFYLIYLIAMILGVVVNFNIINSYPLIKIIGIIVSNLLLVQAFIPNPDYYFSLNGVGWYLSSLGFCYLTYKLYKKFLNKVKRNNLIITIVLLWIFQLIISILIINLDYSTTQWIMYINPVIRSINFFMGMVLAKLFIANKNELEDRMKNLTFIEFTIILIFLVVYIGSIFIPRSFIWSTYYSPIIMIIIYLFSFEKGCISKFLGKKIFITLSRISFEFYIFHQVILTSLWKVVGDNKIKLIGGSLIITLLISKFVFSLKNIKNILIYNKTSCN